MGVLFAADEGRNEKEKAEMVVVLMVVLVKELLPLGGDFRFCPILSSLCCCFSYIGCMEIEIVSDITTSSTGISLSYTCALGYHSYDLFHTFLEHCFCGFANYILCT